MTGTSGKKRVSGVQVECGSERRGGNIASRLSLPIHVFQSFCLFPVCISPAAVFVVFRRTTLSFFFIDHCAHSQWLHIQHVITLITSSFDYNVQPVISSLLFTFMFVIQEKYCCADDNYGFLPFPGVKLHNSH